MECGIYAIDRDGVIELVNEPMSKTKLKETRRRLKGRCKLYYNGI